VKEEKYRVGKVCWDSGRSFGLRLTKFKIGLLMRGEGERQDKALVRAPEIKRKQLLQKKRSNAAKESVFEGCLGVITLR